MSTRQWMVSAGVLAAVALALTGCPLPETPEQEYDRGFDEGFMEDDEYWYGYFHGYDTVDSTILYDGHEIPYLDEYSYDAGYYDGLWWAYNDGYFVNYSDAFVIGWSEGYDRGYRSDYLDFLAWDQHTEYLHGGWIDAYNDGFSEGRIFGAADYEDGRTFDWMDALFDYEDEVDLYFEEVDLGTGEFGPVILYEWGQNPHELEKTGEKADSSDAARERIERAGRAVPAIRGGEETKAAIKTEEMYRPLTDEMKAELDVKPDTLQRTDEPVSDNLDDTWLDRVTRYREAVENAANDERDETPAP
ncbi:MAG: hypothetical protein ACLFV4_05840 [Candidatus Hydrogenedentota bacterium]